MAKKKLTLWAAVLALALPLFMAGTAGAVHIGDGSKPNGTTGGWDITDYGTCFSGVKADGTTVIDTAHNLSRADCIDHVLSVTTNTAGIPTDTNYDTQAKCIATTGRANGDDVSHYWVSNVCVNPTTGQGINLDGLDRTAGNCTLKGGVRVNACTGAWTYTGPAGDGAPGFCYTTIIVGSGTIPDANFYAEGTCPTLTTGFTATGTGSTYKCTYTYGTAGYANANIAKKDGSGNYAAANSFVDLGSLTQGQCMAAGANWSTGTTKSDTTSVATAIPSTLATVETTRAGCLECHNQKAQYNTYAERWKEPYLRTGHKNMLRKVTAGSIWAGPDGVNYETTGWVNGSLNFGTATASATKGTLFTDRPLLYIFGDWMAAAPDGLDVIVDMGTGTGAKYNGGSNYSCAPCHSTGWNNPAGGMCSLSSKTTQAACETAGGTWYPANGVQGASYTPAEPAASFPGITFSGAGRWDLDGIQCARCHYAVFSKTSPAPAGTGTHNVTPATTANQQVNNICFGCHQSIGKINNGTGADNDLGNPALNITVTNRLTAPAYKPDFSSHPITNQFLNSPHAKYTVPSGSNGIVPNNLGKYDLVGNAATQYASTFRGFLCRSSATAGSGSILATVWKDGAIHEIKNQADCNLANGQPAGATGYWQQENKGACTTCHDVHQSLFDPAAKEPLRKECETCHIDETGTGGAGYKAAGVPQIDLLKTMHPTGFGTPWDRTKHVNACEVCHMPKASDAGFPIHLWRISTDVNYSTFPTSAQFLGNIKKNANVDANGLTWIDVDIACGQCHGGSAGAGATKDGAFYRSKDRLASWANGFHNLGQGTTPAPTAPTVGKGDVTTVLYTVSFTDASTNAASISVNWGDGNVETKGAGSNFSHTYSVAKTYQIIHIAENQQLFSSETFKVTVPQKFSISGSVPSGTTLSLRLNGRTIKTLLPSQVTGDSYTFLNVKPGSYTITAYKAGLRFSNPAISVTVVDADLSGMDIIPLP